MNDMGQLFKKQIIPFINDPDNRDILSNSLLNSPRIKEEKPDLILEVEEENFDLDKANTKDDIKKLDIETNNWFLSQNNFK